MIKIVLTEDMPIVLEGIRLILGRIPDFRVIAEYHNGKELVDNIDSKDEDIILTDIDMPILNGIEATKMILSKYPDRKVIALSMYSDSDKYYDMIRSGAKGFVLKQSSITELEHAVREVYKGGSYFSGEILHNVILNLSKSSNIVRGNEKSLPEFSETERNLLIHICNGFSNKELADELSISLKTVESRKKKLLEKTEVRNTAGLIIWAVKNKVINL